jgi:membrane protein YdbS with pleckstrin-like domain
MSAVGVTPSIPFRLFEGETILATGRAAPQLLMSNNVMSTVLAVCTVVLLPLLPLLYWVNHQSVQQHRWWLTDRRLVVANGVIGRSVRSVPLERVVDVTIKSTWWDRVWGLEHVTVRDMTGEVSGNTGSTGLALLAVDDADAIADRILTALPRQAREEDLVAALRQLIAA